MRVLCLILCSLLIAGCGDTFNTPVNPEYRRDTVVITWVELEPDALAATCTNPESGKKALACAYISKTGPCTIYTHKNPSTETMGHEALHCFLGRWHG
mgnify:FL=1